MVSYSTLQISFLQTLLKERYGIDSASVVFLKRGFNDTYKINTGTGRFILRIYRAKRRTIQEIRSELNFLLFLKEKHISLSVPLPDRDKQYIQEIASPEGSRYGVLFSFVEGESLRRPSVHQCRKAGEALGAIHQTLLESEQGSLSWNYEPDKIFSYVRSSVSKTLSGFPEDLVYLDRLEQEIQKRLLDANLKTGICHGNLQPENFYFLSSGEVSFIDFDFSGRGPLLYDLGAYMWYDHQGKTKEMLESFYAGYALYFPLSQKEKDLIPVFGTLRALFLMGMWNRFNDGESNPVWPADQISGFVKKLKGWAAKECGMKF